MNTKHVLIIITACLFSFNLYAQDSISINKDSVLIKTDSTNTSCCDSINTILDLQTKTINRLLKSKTEIENLKAESLQLNQEILSLELNNESLVETNNSLNEKTIELQKSLLEKEDLLQKQIRAIEEKEKILAEKEAIYKEAMFSKKIDSLELASLIMAKNIELDGKIKELSLLEKDINEKESSIKTTSSELEKLRSKAEITENEIGKLKDENTSLKVESTKKDKDIEQLNQKIEFLDKDIARTKKELDDCINKDKKKKVRVVQGIAFKTFRAPQYELAPKDVNNTNVYVINNKNSGNIELDYITGASIKIIDINPEKFNQSTDLSLFIGFGGKDLFKNFYIGPNIMIFNVIHINTGVNFREYEILKSGFNEGDVMPLGTPIPTNNNWKITGYLGITLDLNVFASIAKKS
jgi:predicted  nucleic acid-binding Zn-ribbon protein